MSKFALLSISQDVPFSGKMLAIEEKESFSEVWSRVLGELSTEKTITVFCGEKAITLSTDLNSPCYAYIDSVKKSSVDESLLFNCSNDFDIDSIIKAAVSLHTKVMPEGTVWKEITVSDPRPWINPTVPGNQNLPRQAKCDFGNETLYLVESFIPAPPLVMPFASDLVLFGADSAEELIENLRMVHNLLERTSGLKLSDISYTLNCLFPPFKCKWRAAAVCENVAQLSESLITLILKLEEGVEIFSDPYSGLHLANDTTSMKGKLAFMLPGLGSAYTNMLSDLSMHFPLVREVFDYIDLITKEAGSSDIPSMRIYPPAKGMSDSNSLISADYAVLAVLMAEHSLFRLFNHLGINPDAFMGFSTGEFGVYTMNGSCDVVQAASIFYHQSIEVHRSFPRKEIELLKTVSVFAACENVISLSKKAGLKIYLTADLTENHTIITGKHADVDALLTILENESINYSVAPVAIPYHTDLVSKSVNEENIRNSFASSNFTNAKIESWLCSLEGKGPMQAGPIQDALLGLLKRPISFRQTIKDMHASGITTFVELGPNGILTYQTKEILAGKTHLAIASNLAGKPGITQINCMLAELFVHGYGKNFDLTHLYAGRGTKSVFETEEEIDCFNIVNSQLNPADELVSQFLKNTTQLHNDFNQANLEILQAYLQSQTENQVTFLPLDEISNESVVATFVRKHPELNSGWLSPDELQLFEKSCRTQERKQTWLLGRFAAKQAILDLVLRAGGELIQLNQIEIFNDTQGAPYCNLPYFISIAHNQDAACAIAIDKESGLSPGIDIEPLNLRMSDDLIKQFVQVKGEIKSQDKLEALKYWTGKEAAFKSFTKASDQAFKAKHLEVDGFMLAVVLHPLTANKG